MNIAHKKAMNEVMQMVAKDLPSFMYLYVDQKGKESVRISPAELGSFLSESGFCLYNERILFIDNNIAEIVDQNFIFTFCLKEVRKNNDNELENLFLNVGESLLISKKGILLGLPNCLLEPHRDTSTEGYHFYLNGVVKAKKGEHLSLIKYSEISGFVWKNRIIQRNIELIPDTEYDSGEKGMYFQFIKNITNNDEHFESMATTIGYMIHQHKDRRLVKAVIINDENLAEDGTPMGGTGKGLIVNGSSKIVNVITYDGKNSNFHDDKFAYQSVEFGTSLIFIDDIRRDFKFTSLFSATTSNMVVQRKYEKQFEIPFKDSPKFVITTNYTVKGVASSDLRRKHNVFLNSHYSNEHTPNDDFNCEFFEEWDVKEWNLFDNFMMYCLNAYLYLGLKEYSSPEIELKMLQQETSSDFWEVMKDRYNNPGERFYKSDLKDAMISQYGKAYQFLETRHTVLKKWIEIYAEYYSLKIEQGKDMRGAYFEILDTS